MFRRCKNSQMRVSALALLAGCLLAPTLAAAASPIVVDPLYVEPARPADGAAAPDAGCAIQIVELRDTRREPQTLGTVMLNGRAIQAPADRDAWLRSVFEVGLKARGFKPSFSAPAAEAPEAVAVHVRLHSIWITTQTMNKVGSVVVRMSAGTPVAPLSPEKVYRGDQTAVFWGTSQGEFNGFVDRVWANALDAMAADLRSLCSRKKSAQLG